jgi:hypothetical protein
MWQFSPEFANLRNPQSSGVTSRPPRAVMNGRSRGEHIEYPDHQGSGGHPAVLEDSRAECDRGQGAGPTKLTFLSLGRRKVVRKDWLDHWMEANKTR